jgi:3,4-dihydroxy 2-butanone 4-phosphate synthase/GTP cyclohydrolase II
MPNEPSSLPPPDLRSPGESPVYADPEELIAEIRAGRMVILMDDEDRENEGDLVMAAECVRPEDINFMVRYGRGLICLPISRERCERLRLPLMVQDNRTTHGTRFTVSIEAARGVTTGISAYDRAHTIRTAVAPEARPEDIVQPGHVFPIMAQPGGVLTRAGHTEASCDLARLAGFEPAAAIVEVLNEDGTMARRPDLEVFARRHGLKIGTIASLIRYRMEREMTVARVYESTVPTDVGPLPLVVYEDHIQRHVHFAFVRGPIRPEDDVLVRVHVCNFLGDVLGIRWPSLGWPLREATATVAREGGVLLLLRLPEEPSALVARLARGDRPDESRGEESNVLRTYGVGAQILRDLGVRRMRVLSAPKRMQGLTGFGLEVSEYVSPASVAAGAAYASANEAFDGNKP